MRRFAGFRSATGTGPRFALLMVLVTVTSAPLFNSLFAAVQGQNDPRRGLTGIIGCLYAAGFDPTRSDTDNLLAATRRSTALMKCFGEQPVSYWGMAATAALLAVAGLVYWWLPKVRDRWRRLVPVEAVDADGSLGAELAALSERTGIRSDVRFRVDPARMTSGAGVYGRTGSYTVSLHAGLLARRGTDPEGFRAVVLHELAHIHHRDVDYAYASTVLWRVFVLFALLPDLALIAWVVFLVLSGTKSPWWPGAAPELLSFVIAGLLLAGLVHLARADLLRRREHHADLQAVAWGAHPANWDRPDPSGTVAPLLHRATALLRTHPGWAERRRVLADADRLLRVSPLEMFLTGASASLLSGSLAALPFLPSAQGTLWLTVAMVAPVLCIALGRAVVRSSRIGDGGAAGASTRSGALAGLWLGCGLLVGEFVASGRYRVDWLPPQPQYLLAFLFIAAVPAVWWSQTLRLALGLPKRGARRAVAGVGALVTATVLWGGLLWWRLGGERIALGASDPAGALARSYIRAVPGAWQDYGQDLSVISSGMSLLSPLHRQVPIGAATLLMWLVPLVLLLWQRAGAGLRVRRTLVAGCAGGLVSWAGMALARYVQYTGRPATVKERTGPFLIVHEWWVIATLLAACLLTAAVVAAFSRRHWLLRAVIAAQVVQLMSYGAVFLLSSADGCLGPLNTVFDSCQWHLRNGLIITWAATVLTLTNAVLGSACAALAGAGVARAVRRVRGRHAVHLPAVPEPERESAAGPARRRPVLLKAGVVLALGVPALLLTVVTHAQVSFSAAVPRFSPDTADPDAEAPDSAPPTKQAPAMRAWQTWSWLNSGGSLHTQRINAAQLALNSELQKAAARKRDKNGNVPVDEKIFHRACGTLGKRVEEAQDYFPVPSPDLQKSWSDALSRLHHGARSCQEAMAPSKGAPHKTEAERSRQFSASLEELAAGLRRFVAAHQDIQKAATSGAK